MFGPLTKQGGVEGQRDWGRKIQLGVFPVQIIIKKSLPDTAEEVEEAGVYFQEGPSSST